MPRAQIQHVAHLILTEPQYPFVGEIKELTAEKDPLTDFHCGRRGETYVGFFKIDRDFSRIVDRLPEGTFGFRGLLIGGQYQGLGYGSALLAALPVYLRDTYPDMSDIWLLVDTANARAIQCYEKSGWVVDGPGREGRSGPEQVMRLQLSAAS
ncbi:GNAT family N-acetyltransferase [Yoonia sp. SS1-5]|uniref:GNAT family N-acetyltransferase n=1 Tax=Yoonia rhodophyticola TaxID=3137370 RepID=A0AAN0NLU1_9RHOB